jgi:hypothetical protein
MASGGADGGGPFEDEEARRVGGVVDHVHRRDRLDEWLRMLSVELSP